MGSELCIRDKCKVGIIAEEEYVVEAVLAERSRGDDGARRSDEREYLVKWQGWPLEDCTWEAASNLEGCPKVLEAWEAKKRDK